MTKAKWYFDFISPFAYLQFAQFPQLPTNIEITPVPTVLFIDFFNGILID